MRKIWSSENRSSGKNHQRFPSLIIHIELDRLTHIAWFEDFLDSFEQTRIHYNKSLRSFLCTFIITQSNDVKQAAAFHFIHINSRNNYFKTPIIYSALVQKQTNHYNSMGECRHWNRNWFQKWLESCSNRVNSTYFVGYPRLCRSSLRRLLASLLHQLVARGCCRTKIKLVYMEEISETRARGVRGQGTRRTPVPFRDSAMFTLNWQNKFQVVRVWAYCLLIKQTKITLRCPQNHRFHQPWQSPEIQEGLDTLKNKGNFIWVQNWFLSVHSDMGKHQHYKASFVSILPSASNENVEIQI